MWYRNNPVTGSAWWSKHLWFLLNLTTRLRWFSGLPYYSSTWISSLYYCQVRISRVEANLIDLNHWWWALIASLLWAFMIIPFSLASAMDPGMVRQDPRHPIDFLDMMLKFNSTDLCPDCKVIRTPRSRHCAICNVCVERFDHHCPWINNCVGVRNHGFFLQFLIFTCVFAMLVLGICIECLIRGQTSNRDSNPLDVLCFADWCRDQGIFYTFIAIDIFMAILFTLPIA